ncbi:hypothetical protein P879_04638 [Paragonimus westermani]|uniref:Palmitoyltransferase n=1 Tax=Paragonimus westermani TaxID=34504 RepID=A0A8T0CYY7_9TREM|nr:hypothetical protein P879_04638 [Paragonimus westermani]
MYFLYVIIIYLFGCLCVGFVYAFRSNRYIHVVVFFLSRLKRVLCALFPASLRSHSVRLVDWLVFERHCVYQVVYVFLVIISHYLLIRDVITPLYRYSDSENHLFITLACLFCSGLCYTAVCVTDPGVINVGNIQVFSQIYSYDNVVYTPKECALCSHVIPARSRHCGK